MLLMLSTNLAMEANNLYEEFGRNNGEQFYDLFIKFAKLLDNLRTLKMEFYNMIKENKKVANITLDPDFKMNFYNRFSDEYKGMRDKLSLFSDDLKAEREPEFSRDPIEHVETLDEIYHEI